MPANHETRVWATCCRAPGKLIRPATTGTPRRRKQAIDSLSAPDCVARGGACNLVCSASHPNPAPSSKLEQPSATIHHRYAPTGRPSRRHSLSHGPGPTSIRQRHTELAVLGRHSATGVTAATRRQWPSASGSSEPLLVFLLSPYLLVFLSSTLHPDLLYMSSLANPLIRAVVWCHSFTYTNVTSQTFYPPCRCLVWYFYLSPFRIAGRSSTRSCSLLPSLLLDSA